MEELANGWRDLALEDERVVFPRCARKRRRGPVEEVREVRVAQATKAAADEEQRAFEADDCRTAR